VLNARPPIRLDPALPPILVVVVDTEEEFDWSAEPDRAATSVRAMRRIGRVQELMDEYGIVPTYVIDYPVASRSEGYGPLKELSDSGRAVIGAHLHPWVNPPFEEALSRRNMYPGNLGRGLEARKLDALVERIGESFGARPVVYKAGRYGVGAHTAALLRERGFDVDVSVCPPVDYSADGGPDFSEIGCEPYWIAGGPPLLELPLSGAWVGWAGAARPPLYRLATRPALKSLKLPAVLSRLRAADRLMLSPEGFTSAEHVRLTRSLLRRGVRTFTWSFHSPTVLPGATPYAASEGDVERFLASFRRYFDFFFGKLGGSTLSMPELKLRLEASA